jgi:uncharacterized protein (DUF952 family)
MIYHVTSKAQWQQALSQGYYEAPSLALEGFIHLSKKEQVQGVLKRYYQQQTNLLLLHIDTTKLTMPLKYEIAPSVNESFPHLYGRLNLEAVVVIADL